MKQENLGVLAKIKIKSPKSFPDTSVDLSSTLVESYVARVKNKKR